MKKFLVEYLPNNSGGSWWLNDEDWKNLEKAGWLIVWFDHNFDYNKQGNYKYDNRGLPKIKKDTEVCVTKDKKGQYRWLGALARNAFKRFDNITDALKEFEKITGQDISEEGCNCCGAPHSFHWEDQDGNRGYCSGEDCLEYLYPDKKIPNSIRDSLNN